MKGLPFLSHLGMNGAASDREKGESIVCPISVFPSDITELKFPELFDCYELSYYFCIVKQNDKENKILTIKKEYNHEKVSIIPCSTFVHGTSISIMFRR